MEPKIILVMAGNHRQYEQWCKENNFCRRTARYISRPEDIMGLDNCHYVRTGQFWLNQLDTKITYDMFLVKNITEYKPHTGEVNGR